MSIEEQENKERQLQKKKKQNFKRLIDQYNESLQKIQEIPSVKHISKYQQNQLEDKIRQKQSIEYQKINMLINPGPNSFQGPDMFEVLSNISKGQSSFIRIPDTLYQNQSNSFYFYNDTQCSINCIQGDQGKKAFFDKVQQLEDPEQVYPLLCHKVRGLAIKAYYTLKEAISGWNQRVRMQILQFYILPPNQQPILLRVHWQKKNKPKYFLLSSKQRIQVETLQRSVSLPKIKPKQPQTYQVYYANRMLKQSFSPNMPFQSSMVPRQIEIPQIKSQQKIVKVNKSDKLKIKDNSLRVDSFQFTHGHNSLIDYLDKNKNNSCDNLNFFNHFFLNPLNATQSWMSKIQRKIKEVDLQVKNVIKFIQKYHFGDNNCIEEIVIDFIKDNQKKWYFLSNNKYRLIGDQSEIMQIQPPPKFVVPKLNLQQSNCSTQLLMQQPSKHSNQQIVQTSSLSRNQNQQQKTITKRSKFLKKPVQKQLARQRTINNQDMKQRLLERYQSMLQKVNHCVNELQPLPWITSLDKPIDNKILYNTSLQINQKLQKQFKKLQIKIASDQQADITSFFQSEPDERTIKKPEEIYQNLSYPIGYKAEPIHEIKSIVNHYNDIISKYDSMNFKNI